MQWEVLAQVMLGFVMSATAMDVKWLTMVDTDCPGANAVVIDNITMETCQAQCLATQPDCKAIVWVIPQGNRCHLKATCDPAPNTSGYVGVYTSIVNWVELSGYLCDATSTTIEDLTSASLSACQHECLARQPACHGVAYAHSSATCSVRSSCTAVYATWPDVTVSVMCKCEWLHQTASQQQVTTTAGLVGPSLE